MNKEKLYNHLKKEAIEDALRVFDKGTPEYEMHMDITLYSIRKLLDYTFFDDPRFTERLIHSSGVAYDIDVRFLFNEANKQFEAYKKIKEYESTYGERVNVWISTLEEDEDWVKCLELVEWSIDKIKRKGSDKPVFEPTGDQRYRVAESKKLWVINRSWNGKPENIEKDDYYVGIVEEIERKTYQFQAGGNMYVQYKSQYYPVHDRFEFASLVTAVKRGKVNFFSNIHNTPNPILDIIPKEFICWDEGFDI